MDIFVLEGARMTSVEETHRYLAETLRFPTYYGANLDALADCLSELGSRACVVLTGEPELRRQLGAYADRLIGVFEEASAAPHAFGFVICGE